MSGTMTDEQQRLVTRNHNLIYSFLNKYQLSACDWYDVAAIGLCKAAMTYVSGVSSFSTYAYQCMRNEIYCEMRKENHQKMIPRDKLVYYQANINKYESEGKGAFVDLIPSYKNIEDEVINRYILSQHMQRLNERDKKIIHMLFDGCKQKEICNVVGCSRTHITNVKNRLIKSLYIT